VANIAAVLAAMLAWKGKRAAEKSKPEPKKHERFPLPSTGEDTKP
jgi:hypothetical protein